MPGSATAQLLSYATVVDVDMDQTNDVNLADVEDYGHRVVIEMDKTAINDYLLWQRAAGSPRPSAMLDPSKEAAFIAALETALTNGFVDIDGVTAGLNFSTAAMDTNTDPRLRASGVSANDIALAFVLYKLYGSSAITTLDNIFNLQDAHGMLENNTIASAIVNSFKASEAGSLDTMFRDLLAADPHRFFDSAGVPDAGIFETRTDVTGYGNWKITANDIIEVKTKLIFQSKVTRRGVAGLEHLLTDSNSGENQQVVINPGDYFYIRLQIKAIEPSGGGGGGDGGGEITPTVPLAPTGLTATSTDTTITISFTQGSDGGSPITNYKYSTNGSSYLYYFTPQTSSPFTISGLVPGISYTIRLKAVNAIGDSEVSESVTISTVGTAPPMEANGTGDFDTWPVTSTPLTFIKAATDTPTRPAPEASGASADYMGGTITWGANVVAYDHTNNESLRNLEIVSPEDPADTDGDAIENETIAAAADFFPAGSLTGKAVLIQRGSSQFAFKAYAAQEAGAKLVIIYNSNAAGNTIINMFGGTSGLAEMVYIPTVMIGNEMGHRLVKQVRAGTTLYAKYKYFENNSSRDKLFVYANIANEPEI